MSEHKIKLVLDTNTIISGLFWKGNEFQLLEKIEKGNAELFLTQDMLLEIGKVLHYPRLEKYVRSAGITPEVLLEKIISFSILLDAQEQVTVCRDPEDDKVISCAIAANAQYIVTGDEDLLVLKKYKGIQIITTKEVLELLS